MGRRRGNPGMVPALEHTRTESKGPEEKGGRDNQPGEEEEGGQNGASTGMLGMMGQSAGQCAFVADICYT